MYLYLYLRYISKVSSPTLKEREHLSLEGISQICKNLNPIVLPFGSPNSADPGNSGVARSPTTPTYARRGESWLDRRPRPSVRPSVDHRRPRRQ